MEYWKEFFAKYIYQYSHSIYLYLLSPDVAIYVQMKKKMNGDEKSNKLLIKNIFRRN